MSHPVWDEWIEIIVSPPIYIVRQSHPVWDEWIEIYLRRKMEREGC